MDHQLISKQAVHQVLSDYWKQYKKYPTSMILGFSLPAIGTILVHFVPPLIVAKIINSLASKTITTWQDAVPYVALMAGFWLVGEILWRIGTHFMIKLEEKGINNLTKDTFKKLALRDYDFYTNNFVGSLVKKGMSFSRSFEILTDTLAYNVTTNILPIIFAVVILWGYSPWIPLVLVFWVGITVAIALPLIRRRSKLVAKRHDASSRLAGRFSDSIANMLTIKSFAQEKTEEASFGNYVDTYTSAYKKAYDYQNLKFEMVISPIYVATNVFGLLMAVFFTLKFGLEVGATVVVFSYYSQITRIFWDINRIYRSIESSVSEAAEFAQLLIKRPRVEDNKEAAHLSVIEPSITFRNVNFSYESTDENEELFLNNFNLEIKSNQKIGLVGPSGGGKTTITKLLLRFIDIDSGEVTVDGQDIRLVSQETLRGAIAYVPQEPLLFHRSLFENIAYGGKNPTQEEVIAAAKIAHAHEFIVKLPHGYDTLVGERGVKLSGGQRQRVAIARALLKKAPIIVLDEATSSLDSESEKYIQDGLWELMKDKTALVIAHRLSTIKHLDRIIVLDQGKIVQDGKHEDLIQQEGLYSKLWGHQSGEILED